MNEEQRQQITNLILANAEYIENSLNNYLIENILTQIPGLQTSDLNALAQASETFMKWIDGEL